MLQMVGAGYGVTLLPEIVVRSGLKDPRVAIRRFTAPRALSRHRAGVASTSPRAKDFTALARVIVASFGSNAGSLREATGRSRK
jgi:LysR family hydrogen peroxide-inducible transcriptional activator